MKLLKKNYVAFGKIVYGRALEVVRKVLQIHYITVTEKFISLTNTYLVQLFAEKNKYRLIDISLITD